MLIDKLHPKLVNIECMPTSTKFNAIIDLETDIGDLLPYLATEIRGCTYFHGRYPTETDNSDRSPG
jgi:hypothetical protein